MGQSAVLIRDENIKLEDLISGVKQALDNLGYLYNEEPYEGYTILYVRENQEYDDRQLLFYLLEKPRDKYVNYDYQWIKKGVMHVVTVDRFYDREDMLLKFVHAYLDIFPNDFFYDEMELYYTKADIDRIWSMPFDYTWCYKNPSEIE